MLSIKLFRTDTSVIIIHSFRTGPEKMEGKGAASVSPGPSLECGPDRPTWLSGSPASGHGVVYLPQCRSIHSVRSEASMLGFNPGVWFLFPELIIDRKWFLSPVGKFTAFQFVPVIVYVIITTVEMLFAQPFKLFVQACGF